MSDTKVLKAQAANSGAMKVTAKKIKSATALCAASYIFFYKVKGAKNWRMAGDSRLNVKTIKVLKRGKTYTIVVSQF